MLGVFQNECVVIMPNHQFSNFHYFQLAAGPIDCYDSVMLR